MRAAKICLIALLLAAGCAPTNGRRGLPLPNSSAHVPSPQYCPGTINRARAGGTVGSLVGFVAASALGSPLLGILYQVGGYAAGFASADPCRKETATLATMNPQTATDATGKIAEEDLK